LSGPLAPAGAFVYAGRRPAPAIEITKPVKYVGQSAPVEVAVTAPGAKLSRLEVVFEQNGKQTPIAALAQPASAEIKQDGPDKGRGTRTISREQIPDLKTGPAKIIDTAQRPVVAGTREARDSASPALPGMRKVQSRASHELQVRLEKPMIAVISTKHYINLGGSEMVVY